MREYTNYNQVDSYTTITNNSCLGSTVAQDIPPDAIRLGKQLYRGKYGTDYLAEWTHTAQPSEQVSVTQRVVVKKVNVEIKARDSQNREDTIKRLKKEVSALACLDAPNIVKFHGYSTCSNPYKYHLVLEYCSGGSLRDRLSDKPDLPWTYRWQIATDSVRGLAYLHESRYVHGDLAARNILLDAQGRAKLANFGLSDSDPYLKTNLDYFDLTKQEAPWRWTAPEILSGTVDKVDCPQDMYSYGTVLWELTSPGKKPYWKAGQKLDVSLSSIKDITHSEKREQIPDNAPSSWKGLIARCWRSNPSERPSAAQALGELITGFTVHYQKTPEQAYYEARLNQLTADNQRLLEEQQKKRVKCKQAQESIEKKRKKNMKKRNKRIKKHSSGVKKVTSGSVIASKALFYSQGDSTKKNNELQDRLVEACKKGQFAQVKRLVSQGAHPRWADSQGVNPLVMARVCRRKKIVSHLEGLLNKDPRERAVEGWPAYNALKYEGDSPICDLLGQMNYWRDKDATFTNISGILIDRTNKKLRAIERIGGNKNWSIYDESHKFVMRWICNDSARRGIDPILNGDDYEKEVEYRKSKKDALQSDAYCWMRGSNVKSVDKVLESLCTRMNGLLNKPTALKPKGGSMLTLPSK